MVLLVLTGCTTGVTIDPASINFDDWQQHITEYPNSNSARMHLDHAIRFMHNLDTREQAVNQRLATYNKVRSDALEADFRLSAQSMISAAKRDGIRWEPRLRSILEGMATRQQAAGVVSQSLEN